MTMASTLGLRCDRTLLRDDGPPHLDAMMTDAEVTVGHQTVETIGAVVAAMETAEIIDDTMIGGDDYGPSSY